MAWIVAAVIVAAMVDCARALAAELEQLGPEMTELDPFFSHDDDWDTR